MIIDSNLLFGVLSVASAGTLPDIVDAKKPGDAILDELLRRDPFPASLSPDLVEREMAFMRNSVLGLAASLDASTPKSA